LHGRRIERQQRAKGPRGRTQPLQERGADVARCEAALRAALVVDRRVDRRLRIELAEREEDALGAAQVEQEVMDERDAALGWHGRRVTRRSVPTLLLAIAAFRGDA